MNTWHRFPATPWFAAAMTPEDRDRLAGVALDLWHGTATSKRGPFTFRAARDGVPVAGIGRTPTEAITRALAKLEATDD